VLIGISAYFNSDHHDSFAPTLSGGFLLVRQACAKRHRLALSRPAVMAARDDFEVQVLCESGKGNH